MVEAHKQVTKQRTMERSDVQGADTARLTQASEQTVKTARQDALPEVAKPIDQKITEPADETHDGDGHEDVDQLENTTEAMNDLAMDDEPAKKKKKKKSKSSKKKRAITGFEGTPSLPWLLRAVQSDQVPEFYCDAPVTPEQAAEEKKVYAS